MSSIRASRRAAVQRSVGFGAGVKKDGGRPGLKPMLRIVKSHRAASRRVLTGVPSSLELMRIVDVWFDLVASCVLWPLASACRTSLTCLPVQPTHCGGLLRSPSSRAVPV